MAKQRFIVVVENAEDIDAERIQDLVSDEIVSLEDEEGEYLDSSCRVRRLPKDCTCLDSHK